MDPEIKVDETIVQQAELETFIDTYTNSIREYEVESTFTDEEIMREEELIDRTRQRINAAKNKLASKFSEVKQIQYHCRDLAYEVLADEKSDIPHKLIAGFMINVDPSTALKGANNLSQVNEIIKNEKSTPIIHIKGTNDADHQITIGNLVSIEHRFSKDGLRLLANLEDSTLIDSKSRNPKRSYMVRKITGDVPFELNLDTQEMSNNIFDPNYINFDQPSKDETKTKPIIVSGLLIGQQAITNYFYAMIENNSNYAESERVQNNLIYQLWEGLKNAGVEIPLNDILKSLWIEKIKDEVTSPIVRTLESTENIERKRLLSELGVEVDESVIVLEALARIRQNKQN